jgi:hypothetical protein
LAALSQPLGGSDTKTQVAGSRRQAEDLIRGLKIEQTAAVSILKTNKKRGFCQKSAFFGRLVKEATGFLNKSNERDGKEHETSDERGTKALIQRQEPYLLTLLRLFPKVGERELSGRHRFVSKQ